MYSWRITKYNPKNRDLRGIYLNDEWTSYSEIGSTIQKKLFTYEEYIKIENAYVEAIILFLKCNKLDRLCVVGLEKTRVPLQSDCYVSASMKHMFDTVENECYFDSNSIEDIARLVLREKLWCKLEASDMFVHFGWDYYMYIGSTNMCDDSIEKIQKSGLYVEQYESPYLDVED